MLPRTLSSFEITKDEDLFFIIYTFDSFCRSRSHPLFSELTHTPFAHTELRSPVGRRIRVVSVAISLIASLSLFGVRSQFSPSAVGGRTASPLSLSSGESLALTKLTGRTTLDSATNNRNFLLELSIRTFYSNFLLERPPHNNLLSHLTYRPAFSCSTHLTEADDCVVLAEGIRQSGCSTDHKQDEQGKSTTQAIAENQSEGHFDRSANSNSMLSQ